MRLLPLLLLLAACAPSREGTPPGGAPPADHPVLEAGWSFGKCWGECAASLHVGLDGAVSLQVDDWSTGQAREVLGTLDADADAELAALYDALPRQGLQQTYGCPDCADGGAFWFGFDDDLEPARVTIEFGNPPEELADLEGFLLPLMQAMNGCDDSDGSWVLESCEEQMIPPPGDQPPPDPDPDN